MPCLWSAWLELSPLLENREQDPPTLFEIKDHWMKNFYLCSFHLEMNQE